MDNEIWYEYFKDGNRFKIRSDKFCPFTTKNNRYYGPFLDEKAIESFHKKYWTYYKLTGQRLDISSQQVDIVNISIYNGSTTSTFYDVQSAANAIAYSSGRSSS